MITKPVIILGAGATKACGGPLTDEILPLALSNKLAQEMLNNPILDREELLYLTKKFMGDCFFVPENNDEVSKECCPSLPMVLSMLRRSTMQNLPIGSYKGKELIKAKRAVEYSIFAVIEAALKKIPRDKRFHTQLLEPLYKKNIEPTVISLNYDVIVDNAMFMLSESFQAMKPPDYCVNISTHRYSEFIERGTFGHLLKIHGSLNWMYCEKCHRLDLFISEGMRTAKALDELYHTVPFKEAYSCQGTRCRNHPACDGTVNPILITPTFIKDYENPHIDKVWQEAERKLKEADRAIIIGYSLPNDDVEVAMLLKRGLDHLKREQITVVEYVEGDSSKPIPDRTPIEKHTTGSRFKTIFGPNLDWHTTGFQGWLKEQEAIGEFPFA
jgi:hypothetical protein